MEKIRVRITFIEDVLGTSSADKDLHDTYIASKAPDAPSREEEVEAIGVAEVVKKDMTIFPRTESGTPFLWDYQIKGFFKDSCGCLKRADGTKSSKIKAYKKEIDGLIFVDQRRIPLICDHMGDCQRPLRAQTPQGERVAIAHSETVPAGTKIEFTITVLKADLMGAVREWLDYGELRGIGQWRNSGKGRFVWSELDNNGKVIGGNAD